MKSKTLHVMLCSLKESKKELILSLSNNFYIRHEAMWFNFQGIFIFLPFIYFSLFYACYWMWNIISKFKRKKENENEKIQEMPSLGISHTGSVVTVTVTANLITWECFNGTGRTCKRRFSKTRLNYGNRKNWFNIFLLT